MTDCASCARSTVGEPLEHNRTVQAEGHLCACDLEFGDGSIDGIKMATLAKAPIYLLK